MSHILVVGASERSMTNSKFVPFQGIGYKLNGHCEAPDEFAGTPEASTPLHPVPSTKLDTLISHLRAVSTAMEAAASAVMALHKKSEVHEREIGELSRKVSCLTHQPHIQQYNHYNTQTTATLPLPHSNDTEDEISAADPFYSCQEESAHRSMINNNEIQNQIWSNNRNPGFEHSNYPSDKILAQHNPNYRFSEVHATEISSALPDYQSTTNVPRVTEQTLNRLQTDQHERRERRIQAEDQKARKLALKHKDKISKLTLEDLMRDKDEGWIYLLKWIEKIEANSIGDRMRLHMLQITATKGVLKLLNLDEDNTTWNNIKKRLFHLVPKGDIQEAQMKILQVPMRPENNIIVFAAKVQEKYQDVCDLFAVNALPLTVDHCIAINVTCQMTKCGKLLYFDSLKEKLRETIKEMEKSFQNKKFWLSLFQSVETEVQLDPQTVTTNIKETFHQEEAINGAKYCPDEATSVNTGIKQSEPSPHLIPQVLRNSHSASNYYFKRRISRYRKPRWRDYGSSLKTRCKYWEQRCCNFGPRCWFQHWD